MKYSDNAINIFSVKSFKGIGRAWIVKNLKGNEDIETIVSLLNNKSKQGNTVTVFDFEEIKCQIKERLQKLEDFCDGIVALGDHNFPQYRGNVKDSDQPVLLYYKGNIDLLDIENKNISVIGLLNPEGDIEERERNIVAQFVDNGATIISGLAFGCDSISHQQALDSNGLTVAILPSPLNNILPTRNKGLAYKIVEEGGLLVTEYGNNFKNTMELSSRYKERDRLQALFCDAIVLAASYAKDSAERWNITSHKKLDSGARLAMGFAKNYNIQRAVMYDESLDHNNPMFDLNRDIINEQEDVAIITSNNISTIARDLVSKNQSFRNTTAFQTNLFK